MVASARYHSRFCKKHTRTNRLLFLQSPADERSSAQASGPQPSLLCVIGAFGTNIEKLEMIDGKSETLDLSVVYIAAQD
jgi:hypothetical protein